MTSSKVSGSRSILYESHKLRKPLYHEGLSGFYSFSASRFTFTGSPRSYSESGSTNTIIFYLTMRMSQRKIVRRRSFSPLLSRVYEA